MLRFHQFRRSLIKPLGVMPEGEIVTVFIYVMGSLSDLTTLLIPYKIRKMFLENGGIPPLFKAVIFYDGVDLIPNNHTVELLPGWHAQVLNITHHDCSNLFSEYLLKYINWIRELRAKIIREEYSKDGRTEWQRFQDEFLDDEPRYAFICHSQDVMFQDMVDIYHSLLDDGTLAYEPHIDYYAEYGLNPDDF